MTVTVASFRVAFPTFADLATYPTPQVQFWLDLGTNLHNAERWGTLLDPGLQLYIAHQLSIEYQSQKAAKSGQGPGQIAGAITGASVGKVSYSRDATSALNPLDGHWNLSSYGLRWKQLSGLVGAGPIQVGAPSAGEMTAAYGWPGPGY
jgi:hypothetical protein